MSLIADERETVVTVNDGEDVVRLYTAQRPVIRRIQADSRWTVVETGEYDGSPYIWATCPKSMWNPLSGMKKQRAPMTEDQKRAAAERLRAAREAKVNTQAT